MNLEQCYILFPVAFLLARFPGNLRSWRRAGLRGGDYRRGEQGGEGGAEEGQQQGQGALTKPGASTTNMPF